MNLHATMHAIKIAMSTKKSNVLKGYMVKIAGTQTVPTTSFYYLDAG